MRRDMEYVRLLLIDLSNGKYNERISRNEKDLDSQKYLNHLELMEDARLIKLDITLTKDSHLLKKCPRLTWEGNEFLETIENDTVWNKTKEILIAKGFEITEMSFEVIKQLAIAQGKQLFWDI